MTELDQIKQLRAQTDASLQACKNALESSGGDIERALDALRNEGSRVAEKKAARETGSGIVEAYVHTTSRIGAMLELRSETDFVARNADFKNLAHEIAMHVAASAPEDVPQLLLQPFIKDESKTIQDIITEAIARFGENIRITRISRFEI